jgi:hypothetical protein
VPTFYGDHQHHDASADVFLKFDKKQACCGVHTMAEVYSTLTRMPGKHRISGEQAMLFLSTMCERLTIVTLDADEYFMAIEAAAAADVVGNHLRCDLGSLRNQGPSRSDLYVERETLPNVRSGSGQATPHTLT